MRPKRTDPIERERVNKLISLHYSLSVYDGEEYYFGDWYESVHPHNWYDAFRYFGCHDDVATYLGKDIYDSEPWEISEAYLAVFSKWGVNGLWKELWNELGYE